MDPLIDILVKAGGSVAGLIVAVYALRQAWADKAAAVAAFNTLNAERAAMATKMLEVITENTKAFGQFSQQVLHLDRDIRDRLGLPPRRSDQ